jgi:hypothetical protein
VNNNPSRRAALTTTGNRTATSPFNPANVIASHIDPNGTRDLAPQVLDQGGRLRVLPASFWAATTREERALFGHRHAIYSFATTELVAWLQERIAGKRAIEIGAGHGVLAEALGIPATDNRMQTWPEIRATYALQGQPTIKYGVNVQTLAAEEAVKKHRPDVVIGCWVTHKWLAGNHAAGGNMYGVREERIIQRAAYIFIGNEAVHAAKPIWSLPHEIHYPPWLVSRSANGSRDFIAVWEKQ